MRTTVFVIITLLVLAPIQACSDKSEELVVQPTPPVYRDSINLSNFSILGFMRSDSSSAQKADRIVTPSTDIPSQIAQREREYTCFWLIRAINPEFLDISDAVNHIQLRRKINGKDDGAYLAYTVSAKRWTYEKVSIEVLDARDLRLLVYKKGSASDDISAIAKLYIMCADFLDSKISILENTVVDSSHSFGTLEISLGGRKTGLFTDPIKWYKNGDSTLFVFKKQIKPGPNHCKPDPSKIIGGIDETDSRALLRFEDSNREKLAQEYLERK